MAAGDSTHPTGEALSAFVDGELEPVLRAEVDRHLRLCSACRTVVNDYRAISDLHQRVPQLRVPSSLRRDLYRRVDREERGRRWALPWALPSANALGLLVTLALLAFMLPQLMGFWGVVAGATMRTAAHPPVESAPAVQAPAQPIPTQAALPTLAVPTITGVQVPDAPASGPSAGAPPLGASPTAAVILVPANPQGGQGGTTGATKPAGQTPTTAAPTATARPAPTATSVPVLLASAKGKITSMDRKQRVIGVTSQDTPPQTWQVSVAEGAAITRGDGRTMSFEELGVADHVEISGFQAQQGAALLLASTVRVLVPPTRVLVLVDGGDVLRPPQFGFTGDWIKHLADTGYDVLPMDPARLAANSSFKDFSLIVIGYPATLPQAVLQNVKQSGLPVLLADPRLVQLFGLGTNVDPSQPTHSVSGKTVDVQGQASPVTRGFTSDTVVANDTLYRTPILAMGTTLGTVTENGQKRAIWSVNGNAMYFGFWWSNTGQNHNATYWTLFDRSVLLLIGRDPLGPTPAASRALPH